MTLGKVVNLSELLVLLWHEENKNSACVLGLWWETRVRPHTALPRERVAGISSVKARAQESLGYACLPSYSEAKAGQGQLELQNELKVARGT